MKIPRRVFLRLLALALALPLLALGLPACESESVDSVSPILSDEDGTIYSFAGLYANPNTSTNGALPLVYPLGQQTGEVLYWLRLLQYGSDLQAFDNAGKTWDGSITSLRNGTASFVLEGLTTAGAATHIAGTLIYADEKSTMNAAWLEPSFSGTLYAQATVSPAITNTPSSNLNVTPPTAALSTTKRTQQFTASGGSGTITWTVSNSQLGTVSPTTGTTVLYEASGISGNNTVTATDSEGERDTAIVTF